MSADRARGAPPNSDGNADSPSGQHHSVSGDTESLPDEVREFLTSLERERDYSPNTIRAYRRDLAEFTAYLANRAGGRARGWDTVDRLTIRGFLGTLSRRGIAKRSAARTLSAVRSFYRYLHRNELVATNPASGIATPKLDRHLPAWLDRAQIDLLFQMAE
ncbi:MAG: site-specific integrase, partial [Gemmatimonadaceae bacterium]